MKVCIDSEIGNLEGVVIHTPGPEVENMTPENAERALYSDILNLSVASKEYAEFSGVLKKVTQVFEVRELLEETLRNEKVRNHLITEVCRFEQLPDIERQLEKCSEKELAGMLVEGVVLEKNNLTNYLSNERFLLRPLHNLFFTRDAAMGMNDRILIGKMANPVRERETMIMDTIFTHHPLFETEVLNPRTSLKGNTRSGKITIEGGDFQVVRKDVFLIGTGIRTSTQGIDFILEHIRENSEESCHVIVQELPSSPESFIHLDMIFTLLDRDICLVYEPMVFGMSRYRTIYIRIENQKVVRITEMPNIPEALRLLKIDVKSLSCGGKEDLWAQEREQWHSGANFFAFAPGKIIGYERNNHTIEELSNAGFDVLKADDIIRGKISVDDYRRCVVTIGGSELARGGGGARCMTMPVKRAEV